MDENILYSKSRFTVVKVYRQNKKRKQILQSVRRKFESNIWELNVNKWKPKANTTCLTGENIRSRTGTRTINKDR